MITNDITYELFCLNSTNRLTQLKKTHNSFVKQVKEIVDWLDKEKVNVYKITTRTEFLYETYVPNLNATNNFELFLNIQYKHYKEAKANINLYIEEYKRVQKTNMDRTLYNKIIKKLNTKLSNEIIDNAYSFYVDMFGTIKIDFVRSKHKMVDWYKSNINKQKLLDEGKIPYSKEEEEKAIELGIEYKGVKYLEFHSLFDLKVTWNRNKQSKHSIPNLINYDYRPSSFLISKIAEINRNTTILDKVKKYNIKPYNYETN